MAARRPKLAGAPTPAEGRLSEAVSRLVHGWHRLAKEEARVHGLSLPQLMVVRDLRETGEIPITRWADMIGASPSATTGLLDGLEEAGILRRAHDREDRRQVLISLTPSGAKLADRLHAAYRARWTRLCSGIPDPQLETTAITLEAIADRQTEVPAAAPEPAARARRWPTAARGPGRGSGGPP